MMSGNGKITLDTTVREVMTKYPAAERIFDKYGLTGCGGPQGPIEPIGFFATVHHVDPRVLIEELNELAARETQPLLSEEGQPYQSSQDGDLYPIFLKTAIVIALTVGATLGAVNLAAMALNRSVGSLWPSITQFHGAAQIFGWVGLFIMGVAYHVLPRLKGTELRGRGLALASYGFVLAGILWRFPALFGTTSFYQSFNILSGISLVIGASLFTYVVAKTVASSPQKDFYDNYVLASVSWFWVLAAFTLGIGIYMFRGQVGIIPQALNTPYLHIGLLGFITMMIFGITLRTIPVFMGLKEPNKQVFTGVFWVLNLGIVIHAGTEYLTLETSLGWTTWAGALGSVLEYGGILTFVYFLNLFRKPVMELGAGVDRSYEKFIKVAYLWLVVATSMATAYALYRASAGQEVSHALVGSYRHALTVGFITMMIFGMAYRIGPVFVGARLHSWFLSLGSFLLLNLGNLVRVVSQPLADLVGGPFYVAMGVSGFIEVVAIGLFGYNIWRTIDKGPQEEVQVSFTAEAKAITKDMIVADVLQRFPKALDVFLAHGFTPLKNPIGRRTLAKAVTIEQACQILPIDLDHLLSDLNAALLGNIPESGLIERKEIPISNRQMV